MKRSEQVLLAIPILFGLVMAFLWGNPLWLAGTVVGAAVLLGFGFAFLPRIPRSIALWVIGLG